MCFHRLVRRSVTMAFAMLGLSQAGCLGPRAAPELPVKGDHRYHGYSVVEARLRALRARDLDRLARLYASDATIFDSETNAPRAVGLVAIRAHHAQLLATCADLTLEVVERRYSDAGRFISDRERAQCGGVTVHERWLKYEIDVARLRIVRAWEELVGGTR